jgi:hypothetical protein
MFISSCSAFLTNHLCLFFQPQLWLLLALLEVLQLIEEPSKLEVSYGVELTQEWCMQLRGKKAFQIFQLHLFDHQA